MMANLTEQEIKAIKEKKAIEREQRAKEAQANRERREQEKQEAAELKKQREFNRQVNYFVMRYMWQAIRGRSADETIYLAFNMSRERYTRIIETGKVSYGKNELDFLREKTGIPKEIFTGDIRFTCPDKLGNDTISDAEWANLFMLREKRKDRKALMKAKRDRVAVINVRDTKRRNQAEEERKQSEAEYQKAEQGYKDKEKEIGKKLQNASIKGDTPFQRMYSFFKNGYGSRLERLQEIAQALAKIKVAFLDECSQNELDQLYRELSRRSRIVNAVLLYRGAKGDFKKNKKI